MGGVIAVNVPRKLKGFLLCFALLFLVACSKLDWDVPQPSSASLVGNRQVSELKIGLISNPWEENNAFVQQAQTSFIDMAELYGFTGTIREVSGDSQEEWEEATLFFCEEGYDLLLGIGWQCNDSFSTLQGSFEEIDFVVIDDISPNEKVKSITFEVLEGAYILGALLAAAFPEEDFFGYVGNYDNITNGEYRYGYLQGLQSVNENAQVVSRYVNSYVDAEKAYEMAMELVEEDMAVIMACVSSVANEGIYQAALESAEKGKPFYTTGISVDQTTEENPYIISGMTKNTGYAVEKLLTDYVNERFTANHWKLGITEHACSVILVTTTVGNYRNEAILSDTVLQQGQNAYREIMVGEVIFPLK